LFLVTEDRQARHLDGCFPVHWSRWPAKRFKAERPAERELPPIEAPDRWRFSGQNGGWAGPGPAGL